MAGLLVGVAVMAVMLTVAMPAWRTMVKREKEEELIFRGMQYARAVGLYQRKVAAAYPPDLETLLKGRFLRKKYADPMVADGEFQILYQVNAQQGSTRGGRGGATQGQAAQPSPSAFGLQAGRATSPGGRGGILGVASKSTDASMRIWNGRSHYNEWQFIYLPTTMQPGMGGIGGQGRGGPGGRGGQAGPGGMGTGGPGRGGQGGRGRGPTLEFSPDGALRRFDMGQEPGRGGRGPGR